MGICNSCESASVATTAKLISDNGGLEEFPHPIKVHHVLHTHPSLFICNSDELDFDDVVSPMDGDEELQPGHLNFALPLSRLNRRLKPAEIATLAVKASAALRKSGERYGGCRPRNVVEFSVQSGPKKSRKVAHGGDGVRRRVARRRAKFTARLATITE